MADTIRERIEAQIALDIEGVTGIGTVRRWSGTAEESMDHLDALITADSDETQAYECIGDPGTVGKLLPVIVIVNVVPLSGETSPTRSVQNRWLGRIEDALRGNRRITETATGVDLACDSTVVAAAAPNWSEGQCHAAIRVDVRYEHDGDDLTALGTAIEATGE